MNTWTSTPGRNAGVSLLEVLIAMLIFSFGMLGLAALQTYSVKTNQGANSRSQATALANTMLDNIRANRSHISDYYANTYAGVSCEDTPAEGTAAEHDLALWLQQVACELPQGEGAVAPISATEVAVCIRWSEARLQTGDAAGTDCVADSSRFMAGAANGGSGSGADGTYSVFIVATRL